jgi:hypothetical protein
LVSYGSVIVVSFGERNCKIAKMNDSDLKWMYVWMIMEHWKFKQKRYLLCPGKAERIIDFNNDSRTKVDRFYIACKTNKSCSTISESGFNVISSTKTEHANDFEKQIIIPLNL